MYMLFRVFIRERLGLNIYIYIYIVFSQLIFTIRRYNNRILEIKAMFKTLVKQASCSRDYSFKTVMKLVKSYVEKFTGKVLRKFANVI